MSNWTTNTPEVHPLGYSNPCIARIVKKQVVVKINIASSFKELYNLFYANTLYLYMSKQYSVL